MIPLPWSAEFILLVPSSPAPRLHIAAGNVVFKDGLILADVRKVLVAKSLLHGNVEFRYRCSQILEQPGVEQPLLAARRFAQGIAPQHHGLPPQTQHPAEQRDQVSA